MGGCKLLHYWIWGYLVLCIQWRYIQIRFKETQFSLLVFRVTTLICILLVFLSLPQNPCAGEPRRGKVVFRVEAAFCGEEGCPFVVDFAGVVEAEEVF